MNLTKKLSLDYIRCLEAACAFILSAYEITGIINRFDESIDHSMSNTGIKELVEKRKIFSLEETSNIFTHPIHLLLFLFVENIKMNSRDYRGCRRLRYIKFKITFFYRSLIPSGLKLVSRVHNWWLWWYWRCATHIFMNVMCPNWENIMMAYPDRQKTYKKCIFDTLAWCNS